MSVSLRANLPKDYDLTQGVRGLRVNDPPPISARSLTAIASHVFTPLRDLHAGHVYASAVVLKIWGNGAWYFAGNVSDTSVVFGDSYAIRFVLKQVDGAGLVTGTLGADATRLAQHASFAVQGREKSLQRGYWQAIADGAEFKLDRSSDLSQVGDDLLQDAKNAGVQFWCWLTSGGDPQDPPPECPPDDPEACGFQDPGPEEG